MKWLQWLNWRRMTVTTFFILAAVACTYEFKANAQQELPTPCVINVPAEWGEFKSISGKTGVVFEDKNGTLRLIAELPCNLDRGLISSPRVSVEIRRK